MLKNLLLVSLILTLWSCSEEKEDQSQTSETSQKETSSADEPATDEEEDVITEKPEKESAVTSGEKQLEKADNVDLDAYLDDPDETGTNIRQSPGGELVMTLVKDDINIEYFLTLTEAKDGWFKIKGPIGGMEEDIAIPDEGAWIHGSVISVDTRNYGNQTIEAWSQPGGEELMFTISEEVGGVKIKDMHGKWVQIEYKGMLGWVDGVWLCGNPLTTCA